MKFAFLVHPLTEETRELLQLHNHGGLKDSWGSDMVRFMNRLGDAIQITRQETGEVQGEVTVIDELPALVSASGACAEGRLYEIPMLAHEILEQPQRAMDHMEQAVADAAEWGAQVVGLGSMTGIVGGRGKYLADNSPLAVTTGNSLTVYAALRNLESACAEAHVDLREETVVVVGVPGSIASAVARMLEPKCKSLLLVGRRESSRSQRLADELNAPFTCDLRSALRSARVVVSATSSGSCIDQADISPGSIVVDIGVPTDVIAESENREDILVLSGGLAKLPGCMSLESTYFFFQHGVIPSCLGETLVLALEKREECYSLGQDLSVEKIESIGKIAESHGFDFSGLHSFGSKLSDQQLIQFAKRNHDKCKPAFTQPPVCVEAAPLNGTNGNGVANGHANTNGNGKTRTVLSNDCPMQELVKRSRKLFARHVNPVMERAGGDLVKTFVKADDCLLWDEQGNKYLDFVAGFGSVNIGHNHPAVANAINRTLQSKAPGFVQAAINPLMTALAERLVMLSPESLEMIFFTNSGSESVEAALKIARAATNRTKFVYCDRSYHGKTLGALSVTGNRSYQQPFEPLVSDCHRIPFDDTVALRRALAGGDIAAFIVEPIQAEGGMIVPRENYLAEVAAICHEYGTLFICDEIQTGLGRTGQMFASGSVSPDIMTIAKSLSGGAVPIGAMLCTRDVWRQAYGAADRFALHTSTFSGGSVACAAGLASLDVIQDEQLSQNAARMGVRLKEGLETVVARRSTVRAVRGAGLLLGVEFEPLKGTVLEHWKNADRAGLETFLGPKMDELLKTIPAIYVMSRLMQRYGIYTQTARSNPLVLRIQPPLTVNKQQVDEFLTAFDESAADVDYSSGLVDSVFSLTGVGNHMK